MIEYKVIREVVGPLMVVEGVSGIKYDEQAEIFVGPGDVRHGKVLEADRDRAVVTCPPILVPVPELVEI